MRKFTNDRIKVTEISAFGSIALEARIANTHQIIDANPTILEWPGRAEACKEIAGAEKKLYGAGFCDVPELERNYDDDGLAGPLIKVRVEKVGYTYAGCQEDERVVGVIDAVVVYGAAK